MGEYVITFSDVMAGAMTVVLGVLSFFVKSWFNNLNKSNEKIATKIKEQNEETNKRIDKLQEKTDGEIEGIKKDINDIKGDFATTFVLREDFFRAMNGVEDRVKSIDGKIDRLLTKREG